MLWPFKEKINMRGLVFRRALGRSWCWSLIGKMPLIKGRRRSSVLAEAVRGANKILLVCQVISTIIFFYYYERDTYAEILHLCSVLIEILYRDIGENCTPESLNLAMHTYELYISLLPTLYWNHILALTVLIKLYTDIDEIVNWYW